MILHRRVWFVGSLAAALVALVVAASVIIVNRVSERADLLSAHTAATTYLTRSELYFSQAEHQVAVARASQNTAASSGAVLNAFASQTRAVRMWTRYKQATAKLGPLPAGAGALDKALTAVTKASERSSADSVASPTRATSTTLTTFLAMSALVQQAQVDFAVVRTADDSWWAGQFAALQHSISGDITTLIVLAVLALLIAIGSHALLGRVARRRDVELAERDNDLAGVARANEFEARLQRALELSPSEERVFAVVEQALGETVPELSVEMLLADSSRAHFQQTVTTGDAKQTGCSVESPGHCPAAQRGEVLVFESSRALDACPYLKDAPTPCSAVCVPVSVSGTTVGVVHAAGPVDAPPPVEGRTALELVSRRASDRIGMMRAFTRSEIAASTDALTGLPNRRSLENSVRELVSERRAYAVAFADLDHFKIVNDKYGHGAGDQALRVFARVLRECLRPDDLCGRYGGEEFVVVLPDCDQREAVRILERIRERLALTLVTADCPTYTSSFGLAMAEAGQPLADVVGSADAALLEAKRQGRNRVVIAEDALPEVSPAESATRQDHSVGALT
ncbi:diguanylate cyclase domain-containing protein [uncultured Jatrophihabitans sp.]|uniref:GGDEF domain-containing protein n=1 Tax=uncultured Jatrophihabitans sp. TaxID=1610747 RepID=UPI0035C96B74